MVTFCPQGIPTHRPFKESVLDVQKYMKNLIPQVHLHFPPAIIIPLPTQELVIHSSLHLHQYLIMQACCSPVFAAL